LAISAFVSGPLKLFSASIILLCGLSPIDIIYYIFLVSHAKLPEFCIRVRNISRDSE